MKHLGSIVAATALAALSSGAARAQDEAETVGVSVEGTVVEVPIEVAVEACGLDLETLRAEWEALGSEVSTMADTSVNADATDLAPAVSVDTPMDSTIDGVTVADGADATHAADGSAAPDVVSDVEATAATNEAGDGPATADVATSAEAEVAGTEGATGTPATPTEGTVLSKAAVCEISQDTADEAGIPASG